MAKIRVLVVDDSVVVRRVVTEELTAQPDIEVAGTAANGRIALEKMNQLAPNLVILDVEMPEMDGLAALARLRESHPHTPVIMFSSLTELGAAATIEALSLGAADFFAKPTGSGGLDAARQLIRSELVPAIRALCAPKASPSTGARPSSASDAAPVPRPPVIRPATAAQRIDMVAIGGSTGGPNALAELFAELPANFPTPILIVQHMPPMFTGLLADRLSRNSRVATSEAPPSTVLQPGRAWVAPGGYHLVVCREGAEFCLKTNLEPPENSCRPAADPLFRSVAQTYGAHSLAVVLTGMGQDGLRGCEAIRAAGGQVLAQDEETSVVWGMPGYVVRAGLADRVAPPRELAAEIVRRVGVGRG